MAIANIEEYLKLVPALRESPSHLLWSSYDTEADTLYINFKKPSHSTDSDITDDDVIIRYEDGEMVGLTILHASKRGKLTGALVYARATAPAEDSNDPP